MFASSPSLQNPVIQNNGSISPSLGGPQFGSVPHAQPVRGNFHFLFVALAVLGLSFLWIRDSHPSDILVHLTKQTKTLPGALQNTATDMHTPGVTLELKNDGITAEIPSGQINIITEQARPGNGITHLARQALTQRLRDESLSLSPQQRIYAEDFVQKAMDAHMLRAGQKLSFPTELLDKAIQKAQTLTVQQIQNLSRYSAYVHFQ